MLNSQRLTRFPAIVLTITSCANFVLQEERRELKDEMVPVLTQLPNEVHPHTVWTVFFKCV